MRTKDKKTIHVISGTHWDREWRYTSEQSKLRLSRLMDSLLDILDSTDYKCFMLDGGQVVLEDYFSVRPENRERVIKYVKDGRIDLVTWYTLPDMFLVCPEAIIRNMLWGKRIAEEHGGTMKHGYTATSYGQNSQFPQMLRGFGIPSSMFYRGTNQFQTPPIFRWQARDGSEVYVVRAFDEVTRSNWFFFTHYIVVLGKNARDLAYIFRRSEQPVHMADDELYEMDFQVTEEGRSFIEDPEVLKRGFEFLKEQAYPAAIGDHVLALNMEDNAKPYELLPKMIEKMNAVIDDAVIMEDTFDDYVDAVIGVFKKQRKQHVHKGELRYAGIIHGFNGLLGMVQSSRPKLKVLNERAETELIHLAEPMASLAAMHGWEYPTKVLEGAWRNLLQNHAHDSICGAAVDQAHDDMPALFAATTSTAREVTRRACEALWKKLDFSKFDPYDFTITVFNPTGMHRSGVQQVVVDIPRKIGEVESVDPACGVGTYESKGEKAARKEPSYRYFDILDDEGRKVPHVILSREPIHIRVERELDSNAVSFAAERERILLNVDVPAFGYRTYLLRPREVNYVHDPKPMGERGLIAQPGGVLENEFLKVEIKPNGTFDLTDKASKRVMCGMHFFEDKGSVGGSHLDVYPQRDTTVTSLGCNAKLTIVENNPLRATAKIELTIAVPSAATLDGRARFADMVDIPITSWITLKKGARRVELRTRLTNKARDHRVRVMFPTYLKTDEVAVESAFAVDKRCFLWTDTGDNMEPFYSSQPMQNFIDLSDGKFGLAILNQGMREYEVQDDPNRTVALTFLRTHRSYMVANEMMTPEEFDRYTGLHSFGELEFKYALYPHKGDWQKGQALREAYDFKVPYRMIQGVVKSGELPPSGSFVSIDDERIMIAALAQSYDAKSYILRLWNSSDDTVKTALTVNLPVSSVGKIRMDETGKVEKLKGTGKRYDLTARGGEIVTLQLTARAAARSRRARGSASRAQKPRGRSRSRGSSRGSA